GFEAWPIEGSTGAPDRQSQGLHGCAVQATLEHGVRDILRSVQGRSRVPSRGIPSRESIEPSDPIEQVRAPPSEPSQALYVTCHGPRADPYRTGHGRPLELPANSSPKQPLLAARAWVAWCASPLLPAEGRRES